MRYATPKTIECVFAERRQIVYEIFAEAMFDRLLRTHDDPNGE